MALGAYLLHSAHGFERQNIPALFVVRGCLRSQKGKFLLEIPM
jgi:hypothetical protein